jgi:hypothetical protein
MSKAAINGAHQGMFEFVKDRVLSDDVDLSPLLANPNIIPTCVLGGIL